MSEFSTMIARKRLAVRVAEGLTRRLSTTGNAVPLPPRTPVIEMQEFVLDPGHTWKYLEFAESQTALRRQLLPIRLCCAPDLGGKQNVMTHFYYFDQGIEQREDVRAVAAEHSRWQQYLMESRRYVFEQHANLYIEAPLVKTHNLKGMATAFIGGGSSSGGGSGSVDTFTSSATSSYTTAPDGAAVPASASCIYEIRKYKLILGYGVVQQFLALYEAGLPSKLGAVGTDPSSELCTLISSEVGETNNVLEIWRHGGGVRAMNASRQAARAAIPWRDAINNIAKLTTHFANTLYKPLNHSNWK